MKVAIDVDPLSWGGHGGIACVAYNVSAALRASGSHDYQLFASRTPRPAYGLGSEVELISAGRIRYWTGLRRATERFDALVTFSPDFVPVLRPTVAVVYDLYPLLYRQWLSWKVRNSRTGAKLRFAALLRLLALQRCDTAVCISNVTEAHVRSMLRTLAPRLVTAHPAVNSQLHSGDGSRVLRAVGIHGRYLLYAGAVNEQKDVFTLVRAHARLRRDFPDLQLVIAGGNSWPQETRALEGVGVIRLREVDDELLSALYAGCEVFVYPSRFDGFGLPVLEAMSFGAAVLSSDGGSLPEVVGRADGVFEAGSARALVRCLQSLLADNVALLEAREWSVQRAADFSWSDMAGAIEAGLADGSHPPRRKRHLQSSGKGLPHGNQVV